MANNDNQTADQCNIFHCNMTYCFHSQQNLKVKQMEISLIKTLFSSVSKGFSVTSLISSLFIRNISVPSVLINIPLFVSTFS